MIRSFRKWLLPVLLTLYALSGLVLMLAEERLSGRPDEQTCQAAAHAAFDWLLETETTSLPAPR